MTTLHNGVAVPPKAIRFVNNQGQPPSKRRRISAACFTCRKRKTRCSGEKPVCLTCTKNGHCCLGYADDGEKTNYPDTGPAQPGSEQDGYAEPDSEPGNEVEDECGKEPAEGAWRDDQQLLLASGNMGRPAISPKLALPRRDSLHASSTSPQRPAAKTQSDNKWDRNKQHETDQPARGPGRPPKSSHSEDARSPNSWSSSSSDTRTDRHRVPYFRYFGPTAIVPGFKQMVVNVTAHRERRRSRGGSFSSITPDSASGPNPTAEQGYFPSVNTVLDSLDDLPVYEPDNPAPVDALIFDLVETFFSRLGCNFPFLRKKKCLRMLKEKTLEPILVDSMCALAARFSKLSLFTNDSDGQVAKSEFGHVFAQRARAATVDTFPCPSVGAVQACLLMAYEGFGANQDSALWMYLGLSIRMALDLGLQKMVGVRYQGEKDPWYTRSWDRGAGDGDADAGRGAAQDDDEKTSPEDQEEAERERADTFWAIFVLDRVISSGTGRPVTFRDGDFDLALPEPAFNPSSGWPVPFPTFIRIIHLYGRVSDVLNNIRDASDITREKMNKLAQMESDLTMIYHKQDPRLNFNAQNFQEYVKSGQGTTFILLHFWFHALIIILHQPALLAPLGGLSKIQLLPNSRELSMSSAKTISDILAFAELIDSKSLVGNPFISQPIYIAACAFLMDTVARSSGPSSRGESPRRGSKGRSSGQPEPKPTSSGPSKSVKHSLLTSTATQNYQRCYQSLQKLRDYWGGIKYILTALDQKREGTWDCETYTDEEYESAMFSRRTPLDRLGSVDNLTSPKIVPMAFSLTGATNSPNPSLTLLYQNSIPVAPMGPPPAPPARLSVSSSADNMAYDRPPGLPEGQGAFAAAFPQLSMPALRRDARRPSSSHQPSASSFASPQVSGGSLPRYGSIDSDDLGPGASESKLHMMTGTPRRMGHAYQASAPPPQYTPPQPSTYDPPMAQRASSAADQGQAARHGQPQLHSPIHGGSNPGVSGAAGIPTAYHTHFPHGGGLMPPGSYSSHSYLGHVGMTDAITLDSQEIDIGQLGLTNELMPSWLEYLPENVLELFGNNVPGNGPAQM